MVKNVKAVRAIGYRQIPNAAFETDTITAEGYRTLAAVQFYDRMGSNGRGCDASITTLAAKALCDPRTVRRWLARLTSMGLLESEKRFGRGVSSTYRVVFEQSQKVDNEAHLFEGETWTAEAQKVDSATFNNKPNQPVTPPKDTLKDTSAKLVMIHSEESARFPEKPAKNASGKGYVAYLSQMDRLGKTSGLPTDKVKDVLDISEALMEIFENGTAEYGIAYRISESYYLTDEEYGDEQAV